MMRICQSAKKLRLASSFSFPLLSSPRKQGSSSVGKGAEACFLIFLPPPLFSWEAGIKLSWQRSRGLLPHLPSPPFPLSFPSSILPGSRGQAQSAKEPRLTSSSFPSLSPPLSSQEIGIKLGQCRS